VASGAEEMLTDASQGSSSSSDLASWSQPEPGGGNNLIGVVGGHRR